MKNTLAIFVCTVLIYMISFTLIINDSIAQTNESQKFTVIKEFDKGQIRYYPPVMKIQSNNNFSSLFNYISGNNSDRKKISMTSPVYMGDSDGNNIMEFVLPQSFNSNNAPSALSNSVKVFESEPGYFLTLEFGGYASSRNVRYYSAELTKIAQKHNLKAIGQPVLLVYDSPYKVIGRKNEMIIQIDANL
jgi:hypothetical protein